MEEIGEKNPKAPLGKISIVQFTGFDDDDFEVGDFDENKNNEKQKYKGEKKRRRGGRKNRQRINAMNNVRKNLNEQQELQKQEKIKMMNSEKLNVENVQKANNKCSRLVEELHQRERVRGMDRLEARQLLHDKLLFRGETNLTEIRAKRFCIVVVSKQLFKLEDNCNIPTETITISMENGKISSVLRIIPSYEEHFNEVLTDKNCKYRMKTVYWNPKRVKDSNLMFKMWNYFLERCFHSLLLVPLSQLSILLDFLRKINEIRSVLNKRATVSICLSRVISIDDFLISMQQLSEIYSSISAAPSTKIDSLLEHGIDLCYYFIHSMKIIANENMDFTSNKNKPNLFEEWNHTEDGLLVGPPPGLSALTVKKVSSENEKRDEIQQKFSNFRQFNPKNEGNFMRQGNLFYSPQFYDEMNNFNSFQIGDTFQKCASTNQNLFKSSTELNFYHRILTWVNNIDINNMCSIEELQDHYTGLEEFESNEDISGIDDIN